MSLSREASILLASTLIGPRIGPLTLICPNSVPASPSSDGIWFQYTPLPRTEPTSVYDPARQRMIVLGGTPGVLTDDARALALSGALKWTRLDSPQSLLPSSVSGSTPVYDADNDRIVVANLAGPTPSAGALPLAGPFIGSSLAVSGAPPPVRSSPASVFDPARKRIIFFGGLGYYNDVWALNLGPTLSWEQLAPAGPGPTARFGGSLIYDSSRDRLVLFGGYGYTD